MGDDITSGIVSIALAILGVATLGVLVSTKSNTAGVIQAAASALANNIASATGSVTGSSQVSAVNYALPTSAFNSNLLNIP